MKLSTKAFFVFAFMLCMPVLSQAQYCHNFHRSNCYRSANKFFKYNGQSKSALMAKGQSSNLNVVVYSGQDYRVSICTEPELGEKMEWRILDGKSKDVLYDNADDEYSQQFEFTCDKTRSLVFEVSVPDGETKNKRLKPTDMACLGLLIEHMATPKSGFGFD